MSRLLAIAVVMCLASGAFAQTGTLDDPVILVEGPFGFLAYFFFFFGWHRGKKKSSQPCRCSG